MTHQNLTRKALGVDSMQWALARSVIAAALLFAGAALTLAQGAKPVKGDRDLGEYLANTCAGCHQLSGKSKAGVPPIVGWPEDQFIAVMGSYKDKIRENKVMQTIAAGLSADDLAGLAVYFAGLKPAKTDGAQ